MVTSSEVDDDVVAITPTTPVKVAAACGILGGALSLVLALQAGALLEVSGALRAVVAVFAVAGLAAVVSGYRLARLRNGAALWSAIATGVIGLSALGWFVFALMNGVLILLALGLVPVSGVGALTAILSLKTVERASRARSRLRAQGLDAGL